MKFILALDQGTTSSRALVFDQQGDLRGMAQRELQQHYPQAGWVEHDPVEICESQRTVALEALHRANISARDVAAIGITNQRETTIVWDRTTGVPIYNAIVWQDRRTAGHCDVLRAEGHAERIQQLTGLIIDAYFSGTKICWLLDHIPGARQRAERGELACGTVDSWLVWQLTGGRLHITDPSNASRTMLYDMHQGDWSPELLELLRVPRSLLPEIRSSSEVYGSCAADVLGAEIPIAGIAGDQQAALFGQNCLSRGMVKNTYGTGCFMLMNLGTEPRVSQNRLLTTVAWKLGTNQPLEYALEGSVFVAGAAVQWLRDGLGIIRTAAEVEELASREKDSGDVYFVPAFTGLGAPHWDAYARGTLVGLTRGTTASHIARAALEGIAFQVADILDAMREDAGMSIREMRVDGGAAANNLLMQFQADVLQVPVVRPKNLETTVLGAAYLAGLAIGFWKDTSDLQQVWQKERVFEPTMPAAEASERRGRWSEALRRSMNWAV